MPPPNELQELFTKLGRMPPQERMQAIAALPREMQMKIQQAAAASQRGMQDVQTLLGALKPDDLKPDDRVSTMTILQAIASCPSIRAVGEEADEGAIGELEAVLLSKMDEADATALRSSSLEGAARRALPMLLWILYQGRLKSELDTLWEKSDLPARIDDLTQRATKLLVQAQAAVPHTRWVQPLLAVLSTSALLVNTCWSGSDEACVERQRAVLEGDGLPYPKLSMRALAHMDASAAEATGGTTSVELPKQSMDELVAGGEGAVFLPGKPVVIEVEITREHAAAAGGMARPAANNPDGILEAYFLVVEGLKADPTPNSLLAFQPLVVKTLSTPAVRARVVFMAPPVGSYTVRAHLASNSVIGIEEAADVSFEVVEDDVPALE